MPLSSEKIKGEAGSPSFHTLRVRLHARPYFNAGPSPERQPTVPSPPKRTSAFFDGLGLSTGIAANPTPAPNNHPLEPRLQSLLGHSSVETTMISLHLLDRPDVGVTSPLDLQPLLQGACARFELCFSSIFLLKNLP